MELLTQLDHLQNRLSEMLRHVPGATTLYLFGSRTTTASDHYADIDLHVVTADLPTARVTWPHVLDAVGPIELVWPITADPTNTAFSVFFHGASYYHKVDIGLSSRADAPRSTPIVSYVPLWVQEPAMSIIQPPHNKAYMPIYGSIGHLLFDELIGSVRYVKARKRQQTATCWRFIRGKPDRVFHLLYEQIHNWESREAPLSTWDYKALDARIKISDQEQLMQHLDWSNSRMMDTNFYWLTQRIVQLLQQKATVQGEMIPSHIVEQHQMFIYQELHG